VRATSTPTSLGVGLYFTLVDVLQTPLDTATTSGAHNFVTGLVARSLVATVIMPFTVVKTRFEVTLLARFVILVLQSVAMRDKSMLSACRRIVAEHGARGSLSQPTAHCAGSYVGLAPTLWRDAPFSALYLLLYRRLLQSTTDECAGSNHVPRA